MTGFLSGFFGRASVPSPTERAALDAARRPGMVFQIGGIPKPTTRLTSWWGGNFIAEPPRPGLVPLVQVRADELPSPLSELLQADYLLIWIDADPSGHSGEMPRIEIQRSSAPDPSRLAPVETVCRLDGSLACLPLLPARNGHGMMLPHPDDAPAPLPSAKSAALPEDEEPVTLGGWPNWIGPSQWPEGARFVMEIRSSRKGKLALPDDGSLYLFENGDRWIVRTDGF